MKVKAIKPKFRPTTADQYRLIRFVNQRIGTLNSGCIPHNKVRLEKAINAVSNTLASVNFTTLEGLQRHIRNHQEHYSSIRDSIRADSYPEMTRQLSEMIAKSDRGYRNQTI